MSQVPVPDFGALAGQQYDENKSAANLTNLANRPNTSNPMGSNTWTMNPDGSWGQNTQLTGAAGNLFNSSLGWQQALGSQIGAGAPQASFGAQQNVIDAWNALQQPGLDKAAASARNRAAAMGITLGSNANNDIERTIGTNEATSRNQGILQGVNAYSDLYKNQLQGFNANRDAMTSLTGVRDSLNPNKWTPDFKTSVSYQPKNVYGAAADTFGAYRDMEAADVARRNSNISGATNLLGAAGGLGGIGNMIGGIGNGIGSLFGSNTGIFGGGDASLWNQWTGTGSYNYDVNNYGMDSPEYQDNSSFWGGYQ